MQSPRYFLVDPHMTDEVFTPVRFFVRKRKGLNKYRYFSDLSTSNKIVNICSTNTLSGVIPKKLFNIFPSLLRSITLHLELIIWSYLNNITIRKVSPQSGDTVLFFLRNMSEEANKYVNILRCNGVKIAWATSHFHLSYLNKRYIDENDIVLIDNQLPMAKQVQGKKILSPPAVNEKFKVLDRSEIKRINRVLCVGTVHMYQEPFPGSIKFNGFYTMHPSRCDVFNTESPFLEKYYSLITDDANLYTTQRSYMGGDLALMYNSYRFAFIGSEASGVAALGVFEAMACGCEVFIEKEVGENIGLLDGINAWFFDGTSKSLLERLNWVLINEKSLDSNAIKSLSMKYRSDYLLNDLKVKLQK